MLSRQAMLPLPGCRPRPGGLPDPAPQWCHYQWCLLLLRTAWPLGGTYLVPFIEHSTGLTIYQRACVNGGMPPMGRGMGRGIGLPRGGYGGPGGFIGRGGFQGGARTATCYKCGGPNHYARDCQAQAMKCYACGKLVCALRLQFSAHVHSTSHQASG